MAPYGPIHELVPDLNLRIYATLFTIESGLRELIIEELSNEAGAQWRSRLPADVELKCRKGPESDSAAGWTSYVDHHPLYYVDFPDLAKTIASMWRPVFQQVFSDKDVLAADLRKLEPVRNKIAHNRTATQTDLDIISAVSGSLTAQIGEDRYRRLITQCTKAPPLIETLETLRNDIATVNGALSTITVTPPLATWPKISGKWWLSTEYLNGSRPSTRRESLATEIEGLRRTIESKEKTLSNIPPETAPVPGPDLVAKLAQLFALYDQFCQIPRGRGTGHRIEQWAADNQLHTAITDAEKALDTLIKGLTND